MQEPKDDKETNVGSTIIISDGHNKIEMTDIEVKKYINTVTNELDELNDVSHISTGHLAKYEFAAICWWLGNCKYLQFVDTAPDLPVLSKDKRMAYPDIFAVFSIEEKVSPCFIVIAEFDGTGQLNMYKTYINRMKEYPLIGDCDILVAGKYKNEWALFNIDNFIQKDGRVSLRFEEAKRANLMGILCGDGHFHGLNTGTRWYYVIETGEDIELVRQEIIPLSEAVSELAFERADGKKLQFSPPLLHMIPFFGTWDLFEQYQNEVVLSGARLIRNKPLHLYQVLVFSTRLIEHLNGRSLIDWKRILLEDDFKYSVDDIKRMVSSGQIEEIGFTGFEQYIPDIQIPAWNADED
ncbi:MAG: hypothetical protein QF682_06995 [Candidatus Thermoplasmatota archaeon]|nr:hypothetical protein [Candidatus Thermoplasmatota archaeon]